MSCALERLPNELLDQIISDLTTEPPSLARLHNVPERQLTRGATRDLKQLALVSQHLADLVRPRLFAHACLDLRDELAFCSFMAESGLGRYVTSLVATTATALADPVDHGWWRRVFRYVDPTRVTVVAPPTFLGHSVNTPIMDGHSWAFDIQLQVLHFERDSSSAMGLPLPDFEHCNSLLLARPWTSMSFNESSSLKAYNHYEYFLSRVPSILGEWGSQLKPQESPPPHLSELVRGLVSFSYTAVFPFYNHVKLVLDTLNLMPELRILSMQLAPDANNHATEIEQRGSMDPNDPWMELATSYDLIAFEICKNQTLQEFHSRDFLIDTVKEELSSFIDHLGPTRWIHDGSWRWLRRPE
ncbi:uncharacterized protein N7459_006541 [Penicillium hispanicum]|uniref:uncharacterized protein n=1 Tax=Penicillium hispanicum TaxID=1080232 RepID=UPI0025425F38|nr:uncharacterized protein N7459_006541 [Penicillium hispanicum]KAJ5577577.1 hypothetical protein N7459_006541 [Penicillium hispanicum]